MIFYGKIKEHKQIRNNILELIDTAEAQSIKQSNDYYNDDIMVELKTRPNNTYENNTIYHKTRNGFDMELDTLYFDSPKMQYAFQYNKKNPFNNKDFFIVWKCKDKYLCWKMNWKKKDYYIEEQNKDFGKGYIQQRGVINVYKDSLIPLN